LLTGITSWLVRLGQYVAAHDNESGCSAFIAHF
jgi:hypothetical protein